ncbi:MAG: serine hydrolase [Bacteroidetes bacterium]|nr:serine hydrolase [Bacteroidota bacterium]
MKKLVLATGLLFLTIYSAQAQIASAYAGRLQNVLDSVGKRFHIKGLSAAVYRPGEGMWLGAYGESYSGVPITTDMYFPIGSNTKTYTSCIMLKLQEAGTLSLDDTIGKWLQNIPNVSGQITIRQMLNHTSGLFSYTNDPGFFTALNNDYTKVWQPEDMLQFIGAPDFAPGSSWEYSNTNYLLAGLIIKKIFNEPYEVTVRRMILDPQGFTNTIVYPAEKRGTIPHGWSVITNNGPLEDMMVSANYDNTAFLSMATSAGAIVATAEDVAKFWVALMNGKIINNNSLGEMKQFVSINANNGYGLGLFRTRPVNGHVVYGHGGTCFGYLNENMVDSANGITIAVLTNQDSVDNDQIFNWVVTALHKNTLQMAPLSIAGNVNEDDIKIYPNPASNYVDVNLGTANNAKFELIDMTGRNIVNTTVDGNYVRVSLSDITPGLYLARLSNTEKGIFKTAKLQVIH